MGRRFQEFGIKKCKYCGSLAFGVHPRLKKIDFHLYKATWAVEKSEPGAPPRFPETADSEGF